MEEFRGVHAVLLTPFKEDESLDESTLRGHVKWLVEQGVHGVICTGSTGEVFSLTDDERSRLAARLAEPTLWDSYLGLLASRGLPTSDDEEILAALVAVARDRRQYGDLWELAEDLLTHDELAAEWRARHVQMVERQIGTKSGTGGSTGAPYLHSRVPLRYYPLLWELRDSL